MTTHSSTPSSIVTSWSNALRTTSGVGFVSCSAVSLTSISFRHVSSCLLSRMGYDDAIAS